MVGVLVIRLMNVVYFFIYIFSLYSIFERIAIPTSLVNSPTSTISFYNQLLYEQQQILPSVQQDVEKLI